MKKYEKARRRGIATIVIIVAVAGTSVTGVGLYIISQSTNIVTDSPLFSCISSVNFHIHAHLDYRSIPIPALTGYQNGCFYPLHTHTPDGIIHIESSTDYHFTIRDFLVIWHLQNQNINPTLNYTTIIQHCSIYSLGNSFSLNSCGQSIVSTLEYQFQNGDNITV